MTCVNAGILTRAVRLRAAKTNGKRPFPEASHVTNWHPGTQYLIPEDLRHFPAKRQHMSWVQISARWFRNPFQLKFLSLTRPYQTVQSPHSCAATAQGSRNIPECRSAKIYLRKGFPFQRSTATPRLAFMMMSCPCDAGWSSPVARQAHNLKVVSSNLAPATK